MKKIIAILLLLVVCSVGGEEFKKPIQCTGVDNAFKHIREQYNEYPFILLKQDGVNANIVLTINAQTNTWSLIEYNDTTACLIGSGSNFNTAKYKPISF